MKKPDLLLDIPLPRIFQILLLVVAVSIPTCYVLKHYDSQTKFTGLILFGEKFQKQAVPEMRAMHPAVESPDGYDGQFYAQLALDPLLLKPETKTAMDAPQYRAQRILMPFIAHAAGMGRPVAVIQAYALLNLFFWFLLIFGMVYNLKAGTARGYLCIFAAVFTTGAMVSLERSLTDLPTSVGGFYGAALADSMAVGAVMMAVLLRQTSVLFLLQFAWPIPKDRAALFSLAWKCFLILAPMALWIFYIRHQWGGDHGDIRAFGLPLQGWTGYVVEKWHELRLARPVVSGIRPGEWEWHFFELASAVSLLYQAAYLLLKPEPGCRWWRMGIGFAVMFVLFNRFIFAEQIAFARAVLPMTLAFNLKLIPLRGRAFASNFLAGNLGLLWGFRDALGFCLS